jgi:hypothetical protein
MLNGNANDGEQGANWVLWSLSKSLRWQSSKLSAIAHDLVRVSVVAGHF